MWESLMCAIGEGKSLWPPPRFPAFAPLVSRFSAPRWSNAYLGGREMAAKAKSKSALQPTTYNAATGLPMGGGLCLRGLHNCVEAGRLMDASDGSGCCRVP